MEDNLHILFLSSWYPSRISPTNGNFVQRHAEAIALKNKVTVVYPIGDSLKVKNDYEIKKETEKGVKNIIVYFKKHSLSPINSYRKFLALKKGMALVKKFDIIHVNILYPIGVLAYFLRIKYRKPIIFTEHWTGYFHPKKSNITFIKRLILKTISKKASYIVPVSHSLKKAMIAIGIKANYKVIGNAVNTNLFYPKEKTSEIFKILHVSTLNNEHKNIEGLLDVIYQISKKRKDFVFQVIGDKNLEKTRSLINKTGIPMQLIDLQGTKTPEQIAKYMQEANLYVSFSNYETFGVVYIEALATETPVVATNTGVLTEYEIEDSYKLIPINDKEQLKYHIEKYMDKKHKIDGNKMRIFAVNNFSYEAISEQYSQLYYKMLKNE